MPAYEEMAGTRMNYFYIREYRKSVCRSKIIEMRSLIKYYRVSVSLNIKLKILHCNSGTLDGSESELELRSVWKPTCASCWQQNILNLLC